MKKRTRIAAFALALAAAAIFTHHLDASTRLSAAQHGRCQGAPYFDTTGARPALPGMRFLRVL